MRGEQGKNRQEAGKGVKKTIVKTGMRAVEHVESKENE
jgi:hypothetical protein